MVRARFCELVSEKLQLAPGPNSFFLAGLLSLIDTMIGRPLEEIFKEMALEPCIANAILGEKTCDLLLRPVLQLSAALERSDFASALQLAEAAGVEIFDAYRLHVEAMSWADSLAPRQPITMRGALAVLPSGSA